MSKKKTNKLVREIIKKTIRENIYDFHHTAGTSDGIPDPGKLSAEEIEDYIEANPRKIWGRTLSIWKMVLDRKKGIKEDNYPSGAKGDPSAPWNDSQERPQTKIVTSSQLEYLGDEANQIFFFVKDDDYFSFDSHGLYSEEDDAYHFNEKTYDSVIDLVNDEWADKDLTNIATEVDADYAEGELLRVTQATDGWDALQDFLVDKQSKGADDESRYNNSVDRNQLDLEEMAKEYGYLKESNHPKMVDDSNFPIVTIEFNDQNQEVEFVKDEFMEYAGHVTLPIYSYKAEGNGISFTVLVTEGPGEDIEEIEWDSLEGSIEK